MQNQETTFCPNCGGQNTLNNNFCVYCGGPLSNVNQQVNTNQSQNQTLIQPAQQNTQPNQQYTQPNQQYTQPQNSQQNNVEVPKKEVKLGFLGWAGIIIAAIISTRNLFLLLGFVALIVVYNTAPSAKKILIIIFKVIGGVYVSLFAVALILFGACFGIIAAGM
jgi:hypothetical protein